jgi:hypothetical protein
MDAKGKMAKQSSMPLVRGHHEVCQLPFVVSLGRRTADLSASNHEWPFDRLRSTILPLEGFEANGKNLIFRAISLDRDCFRPRNML